MEEETQQLLENNCNDQYVTIILKEGIHGQFQNSGQWKRLLNDNLVTV